MRNTLSLLMMLITVLFVSCDEAEQNYHSTFIVYPETGASVLYADQTVDSLRFVTYDSWTLDLGSDWASMDEDDRTGTLLPGYYAVGFSEFAFEPNDTGKSRDCYAVLKSYGRTFRVLYRQLPFLHITHPTEFEGVFKSTVSAKTLAYTFNFIPNSDWTMEFVGEKPDWVDWKDGTTLSGKAGDCKSEVVLEENKIYEDRSFTVRLTSNGISNDITITQKMPTE